MTSKPAGVVLLLHGVDSQGEWFDRAVSVIEPHFVCRSLRYDYYQRLGKLKVVVSPKAGLIGLGVGFSVGVPFGLFIATAAGLASCLASGGIAARRRRSETVANVVEMFDAATATGERPHVIAHSFGSYLIAEVVSRFQREVGRLCLAGSVLRRRFDWAAVIDLKRPLVTHVRNDVAVNDSVVRAAGTLPYLGLSGLKGFRGGRFTIHDVRIPPCDLCAKGEHALVHNYFCKMEHNDHFVGRFHLEGQYLPFLFGIEPTEFRDFLALCRKGAKAVNENNYSAINSVETEFSEREWSWAGGTFERYVATQIHVRSRSRLGLVSAHTLRLVLVRTWLVVDQACDRRGKRNSAHAVRAMWPRIAITRALDGLP